MESSSFGKTVDGHFKSVKPEIVYRISECGGCGFAIANPGPPGHALDDACFCCP